jgi:hypothetical protein
MDRMKNVFREPSRDPLLGSALRKIEDAMEIRDVHALRQRIVWAARLRLAELAGSRPRWWELLSTWSKVAVPIGLAASLAAGILLQGSAETVLQPNSGDMGSDSTLVLAALSEPAAASLFTGHLIAPAGYDWLLRQAVGQ